METSEDNLTFTLAFKWTDDHTRNLIRVRHANRAYFTGKRNAAKVAWEHVLKEMQIDGMVSVKQVKKKWDNLVHKYKELKNARIGTTEGELAATSWPFYQLMDETVGTGPLLALPVVIASIMGDEIECSEANTAAEFLGATANQNNATMLTAQFVQQGICFETPIKGSSTTSVKKSEPVCKKRKRESDDACLELLKQTREDWLRMHTVLERQGERMISMFSEMIQLMKNHNTISSPRGKPVQQNNNFQFLRPAMVFS